MTEIDMAVVLRPQPYHLNRRFELIMLEVNHETVGFIERNRSEPGWTAWKGSGPQAQKLKIFYGVGGKQAAVDCVVNQIT